MESKRVILVMASTVAACVSTAFAATAYINQVGYRPADPKELSLVEGSGDVEIQDASGNTVLKATPKAASVWDASGQNVQLVDFSELKEPGKYSVKVGGNIVRGDLVVKEETYKDVFKAAAKWFYYQRASMALEEQYAGKWARAAGHLDDNVQFHNSTGASGSISSPKGWYDAGDYGKYIVNSGITTYTLLSLYEHFPEYFKALKWNIPADGQLPDLLAEIKYNLDWMLTMQASDGTVYHKLTALGFPGDVMPAQDSDARYVIGKSAEAAFDFAGVMALASRIYKPFDASYASKCLEAAKKAYTWASSNMNVHFKANPAGVSTGTYEGSDASDEKLFAGTELAITTGDASYKQSGSSANISYWGDMSGVATYGKATHASVFSDAAEAKQKVLATADKFVERTQTGFGVVMSKEDFVWGSNAAASNQGIWLLHAYYLTGDQKYYTAAVQALNYLLGKNPLDMSFVTGFGSKSPMMPHHRPSTADGVEEPVPGMLVGGPQPGGEDVGSAAEWKCADYRTGFAATAYTDQRCSYATNEVAINWNAPLAYLAGALEALNAGYAPDFAVEGVARTAGKVAPESSASVGQSSSSVAPVSSSSNGSGIAPVSSSSVEVSGIRKVAPAVTAHDAPAILRMKGGKLFVEKGGCRFDLMGNRVR